MLKKNIALLLSVIFFVKLFSHPHIFIDAEIELITSKDKLEHLLVSWQWDEWFSLEIIEACDKNKNFKFEPNEVKIVFDDFFIGVKDFSYFTEIRLNNRRFRINEVNNFFAEVLNISGKNIVKYYFTIPVDIAINDKLSINIAKDDVTTFTAFENISLKINCEDFKIINKKISNFKFCGKQVTADLVPDA